MDLAESTAILAQWVTANRALTSGQAYTLPDGISVQRVTPGECLRQIAYWQRVVDNYTRAAAGGTVSTALASFS